MLHYFLSVIEDVLRNLHILVYIENVWIIVALKLQKAAKKPLSFYFKSSNVI